MKINMEFGTDELAHLLQLVDRRIRYLSSPPRPIGGTRCGVAFLPDGREECAKLEKIKDKITKILVPDEVGKV